jgi:dolichyl-phosphooligosaccharide-protein glycotransferase
MISLDFKNRRRYIIIGLVTFFSLFALWLRLLPMVTMGNTDVLSMVASDDPLYNLRQVEQILSNFPNYSWFDPMSYYPIGTSIYWGPLFPTIIAFCCMIAGATTRTEIISVGLVIPPLLAAATIAVMYYVGKTCGDWKTGVLASGFTAVVTGQFFYRSLYGYMDHHIAEVLFSTLFCLFYMYAVFSEKKTEISLKNAWSHKNLLLVSALGGITYLLGLFTMPTMVLFAMIVGIFTVIQFIIDVYRNRTSEYILAVNGIIFAIAIIGLLIFGLKNPGIDLSTYSVGHIYAYLGLIIGTGFLYLLQIGLKGKERYFFPAVLTGCGIVFSLVLYITTPQLYFLLIYDMFAFFGQQAITNTVQEARGWALDLAWLTFNYGLLLMAGGILVMIYKNTRDEHPEQIYALVWSLVILFSTWQHIRYEYYLAINVALLAAVFVTFVFSRGWADIRSLAIRSSDPQASDSQQKSSVSESSSKKQKKSQKTAVNPGRINFKIVALVFFTIGLSLLFAYTSVSYSYVNAISSPTRMNSDWRESLEWMANNTPETGVNYFTIYTKDTFRYPSGSYGVMSWWDYGHLITYIAKRIPNANPFQQGVSGPDGAAAYFMSTSEDKANTILDHDGTRYIVTDIEMDDGKFWAMATWDNASLATDPYQMTFLYPTKNNDYQQVRLNRQLYYLTMISRLHNFDGSMATPSQVYYIEYADQGITNISYPIITAADAMNATEAKARVEQYNLSAIKGYHAEVMNPSSSIDMVHPVETVPALNHYRLVHESPTNVFNSADVDVKYVKIFEYVKGAHIKGNGIIEVPVITNTGRSFIYRQASSNGEFIVPYATTGSTNGVKTTGRYTITGTGRQIEVPESAILQGSIIA